MDVSKGLFAVTLIVEDLPSAKAFSATVFTQEDAFEGGSSDDIDAAAAEQTAAGIPLLNGPRSTALGARGP